MVIVLPAEDRELIEDFQIVTQPGRTWQLDFTQNRMPPNMVEGLEAVEQAVYKILLTERYQYPIYSHNYGVELFDLFGRPMSYVRPEAERRIREALLQDDRITAVDNFEFENGGKNSLLATFTVHTIYGELEVEKAVSV